MFEYKILLPFNAFEIESLLDILANPYYNSNITIEDDEYTN